MHIRPSKVSSRPRKSEDDFFDLDTRRPNQRRRLTAHSDAADSAVELSPVASPSSPFPSSPETASRNLLTQPSRSDRWASNFIRRTRSSAFRRDERTFRYHLRRASSRTASRRKKHTRNGVEQLEALVLHSTEGTTQPPILTLELCDDYSEIMSGPWSARDENEAREPVRRASASVNDLYSAFDTHSLSNGALHNGQLALQRPQDDGDVLGLQSAFRSESQSGGTQPELALHIYTNGTTPNHAQPRSVIMSRPAGNVKDIASRFDQNSPEQLANHTSPSYQLNYQRQRKPVGLRESRSRSPQFDNHSTTNASKRVPARLKAPPSVESTSFETSFHDGNASVPQLPVSQAESEMTELVPRRPLFGEVTATGRHADQIPSDDLRSAQDTGRRREPVRANRRQSEGSTMRKSRGDSLSFATSPALSHQIYNRHGRIDRDAQRPQATPSMPNLAIPAGRDYSSRDASQSSNPSLHNSSSQIPISTAYLTSPLPSKTPPPRSSSASAVHRTPRPTNSPVHKKAASSKENVVTPTTGRGRYQPPPLQSQQTLSARIVPPLPKLSPPLRSSRPRQPVSSATTAASRARAADRFDGSSTRDGRTPSEQWLGQTHAGGKEIPRRRIPELDKVDFAARRARIQKAISQNLSDTQSLDNLRRAEQDQIAARAEHHGSIGVTETPEHDIPVSLGNVRHDEHQILSLNTAVVTKPDSHEPHTALTTFDDESPIIGNVGRDMLQNQAHVDHELLTPATYQRPNIKSDPISVSTAHKQANAVENQPGAPNADGSDADTEFAEENSADNSPSDIEDRWGLHKALKSGQGSIRIMLGDEAVQYHNTDHNSDFDTFSTPQQNFLTPLRGEDVPARVANNTEQGYFQSRRGDPFETNDLKLLSSTHIVDDETHNDSQLSRLLNQYQKDGQVPAELLLHVQNHMIDLNRISANGGSDGFMVQSLLDSITQSQQQDEQTTPTEGAQLSLYSIPAVTPDTPPDALVARGTAVLYPPDHGDFHLDQEDDFETSIRRADEEWARQHREEEPSNGLYHSDKPLPPPKDLGYTPRSSTSMVSPLSQFEGSIKSTGTPISRPESQVLGNGFLGTSIDDNGKESALYRSGHTMPVLSTTRRESAANEISHHAEPATVPAPLNATDPYAFQPSSLGHALRDAASTLPSSVSVSSLTAASTRQSSLDRASENRIKSEQTIPTSPNQKRLQKRQHIIRELLDTENTYHQDLKIIEDIYKATIGDMVSHEDKKILFGNCDEVERFSLHFYDELRRAVALVYTPSKKLLWGQKRSSFSTTRSDGTGQTSLAASGNTVADGVDDDKDRGTTIGQTFLNNLQDMDHVYGAYLRNHDAANQRLSALKNEPTVKCWLDECHNNASDITSAWDLDSLLVKPTQRISKYPMLLQQLLDTTPTDHPDHHALKAAAKESVTMLTRINEAKKRAELVDQIINRKAKDDVRSGLAKAFGRRTEKLKERVGIAEAFQDTEFDEIVHKFGGHYIRLQICMRDVQDYVQRIDKAMDQVNNYAMSLEAYTDVAPSSLPEVESKWRRYNQAIREITGVAFPEHKASVQRRVIQPMVKCIELHRGPQNAINQRKKRIVDYAKCKSIEKRGEKPDKKTIEASDMYIALNDHLKLELPKLYNLTASLVQHCLTCFLDIQLSWFNVWERKLRPTIDAIDIPASISHIEPAFRPDYNLVKEKMAEIALCNGSMLAEASSMISSATTLVDSDTSRKRPSTTIDGRSDRTLSMNSDSSPNIGVGGWKRYSSGYGSGHELPLSNDGRIRSNSSYSGRGASWQSPNPAASSPAGWNTGAAPSAASSRPVTANTHHGYPQSVSRASSDMPRSSRPSSSSVRPRLDVPEDNRYSGMFSSALPPDMLESTHPSVPRHAPDDMAVLFVCASLFEFSIDRTRKEAGYPYLTYVRGEVFDVVAQKGELWLAKNQDDDSNSLGWIWEQHFVILSNE